MRRLAAGTAVEGYRTPCEDRVAVVERGESRVLVIADGVGGQSGGARAAEMLIEFVRASVATIDHPEIADTWRTVLAAADRSIAVDAGAGQTTAVVAHVDPAGRIVGASVGDSGAWLIAGDQVLDLTKHQQRKPFLGCGSVWSIPFEAQMADGLLLLGTDGLFKYTTPSEIRRVIRSEFFSLLPGRLIDLVRLRSGALQDDVAIAVCKSASMGIAGESA